MSKERAKQAVLFTPSSEEEESNVLDATKPL
jgi:hypothetical protein